AQLLKEEEPLSKYRVEPLFARDVKTLMVHIFSPRVPEADILTFLRRYVDVQGEGRRVMDDEKVWTGKRSYTVRFRPNDKIEGGLITPPANFSIGPYRGYMLYPGQPKTCRRCGQSGHFFVDCVTDICKRCGELGHVAAACRNALVCNLCGVPDHSYRTCPRKVRSFAAVVT
uniref:CCHC-type domain-containing protein n=1 Tax=Lepisosteus oculatus TaxID=7918 RepID=W5NP97_LEPOC